MVDLSYKKYKDYPLDFKKQQKKKKLTEKKTEF